MPKYIVWYKKEVSANNLKQAIHKEAKTKANFHSIQEVEERADQLMPAIGFEVEFPYED